MLFRSGESATTLYGTTAKNSVVEITTKLASAAQSLNSAKTIAIARNVRNQNQNISLGDIDKQLIILDGREISKAELEEMKVGNIAIINIHKDSSTENKYGEKGKNGVVIINTKK